MRKFVLKLDLADGDEKRRALKTVSTLAGIDEMAVDMKAKKLTVIGTVDPISVVSKLRKKNWLAEIISVGPAKEPEKPADPKKEDQKEEPKKDDAKKDDSKKEEANKEEPKDEKKAEPGAVLRTPVPYRLYYPPPPMNPYHYVHHSMEENPNACAIC